MSYRALEVERVGPVGWIIFNRPQAGNALDATMLAELERAWIEMDSHPEVRVIVNTGNGTAFQTGLDVVALARDPGSLREQSRRTRDGTLRLTAWHNQVTKPVIAAVNGVCAGGGLHFVADADIVIAVADATFLDPHVSIGQVSALETIALARKSPMESVMRLALTGRTERITADRAYGLGIISEVVTTSDALRPRAQAIGEIIARNSPTALAATKRALWGAWEHGLTEARRIGATAVVAMWEHPDYAEGLRAIAEGRDPLWVPPRAPDTKSTRLPESTPAAPRPEGTS